MQKIKHTKNRGLKKENRGMCVYMMAVDHLKELCGLFRQAA